MLIKAITVAVVAVVFAQPLRTFLWHMDWGVHFYKHHPGKCRVVKTSGIGYEDLQILSSGLTFITSGLSVTVSPPHFKTYVRSKSKAGSIQMIDMNLGTPDKSQVLAFKHGTDFDPDTFRPHGLSVLEDKVKGEHLVYVINHVDGMADRVEKFRYLPKSKELQHERSFFSDEFLLTNDLTVLEEDRFYITNNIYFNTSNTLMMLEQLYQLKLGSVLYHNGKGARKVTDGIFAPNGVILSKDKRYLYVSLLNIKVIQVYKRGHSDKDLILVQEVVMHTGLDNFHLSEDGNSLLGGCHPVMHKVISHLMDPVKEKAPSQVIRIPLKDGLIVEPEITQEFYDQGELISGSSVAGVYKNKMLIGSAVDSLVICQLPVEP